MPERVNRSTMIKSKQLYSKLNREMIHKVGFSKKTKGEAYSQSKDSGQSFVMKMYNRDSNSNQSLSLRR